MGRKKRPILPKEAKTVEHGTPPEIFDPLDEEFEFSLDVCATKKNTKCKKYFNKKQNGLKQSWKGHTCWCNPPYDVKSIEAFVDKAIEEVKKYEITVVMLLPAKTDQKWFHKLWKYYKCEDDMIQFRWIEGRIKFIGNEHSAPFSSVVVVVYPN